MWRKLGRVFHPEGKYEWAKSHAYIPTPIILNNKFIRVYVAFWDDNKVGRIGYVDLDIDNPLKVLYVSEKPVLDIGEAGTFDDSGVSPISIISYKRKLLMYYMGWQRGVRVRYYLFTGLAISKDEGETFERYSKVPILDRNNKELFFRSAAYVMLDNGKYRMWYVAGSKWIIVKGKEVPTYDIYHLVSNSPYKWNKYGSICLKASGGDEYGLGRPWIIKEGNLYKMWYSIRSISKGYRIGYAESFDGLRWIRKDSEVGIDVSTEGWDSEMICFASVINANGKKLLFYNGNNYGETGFGVAVWEET